MTESILTKSCSKCKIEKPFSEFSKSAKHKDGKRSTCKACDAVYRLANIEHIKEYRKNKDVVARVNQLNKEKRAKNPEYFRKIQREYRNKNKDKINAQTRARRKADPETIKARELKNRQKHRERNRLKAIQYRKDNKDDISKREKERYQAHKETISLSNHKQYELNKEIRKKNQREYNKTEMGKRSSRIARHKRRAIILNNGTVEHFDPKEVFERDNYICQLCGRKTRPDFKNQYHALYPNLDHIIPISKGGEHSKLNTQCLCRQCNIEKSNTGTGDQLRIFG